MYDPHLQYKYTKIGIVNLSLQK